MGGSVQVQLNRIGDPVEADRCRDAMERATGLQGEHNEQGRLYVVDTRTWERRPTGSLRISQKGWQELPRVRALAEAARHTSPMRCTPPTASGMA